jgi:hypothetical protein
VRDDRSSSVRESVHFARSQGYRPGELVKIIKDVG